ncbi:hypothetical protein MCHI_002234 [Candidatus Magnetoovum chiemensis]|nr:hypothetical protein MCHI_002234 [Candidatus Magnetoovum chiemensis]
MKITGNVTYEIYDEIMNDQFCKNNSQYNLDNIRSNSTRIDDYFKNSYETQFKELPEILTEKYIYDAPPHVKQALLSTLKKTQKSFLQHLYENYKSANSIKDRKEQLRLDIGDDISYRLLRAIEITEAIRSAYENDEYEIVEHEMSMSIFPL